MNDPAQDYDYQKYAILFVDDEEKIRKYFRRLYGGIFRIHEAGDGVEALTVFNEHADEIGVIVTDQRMPNETGVGFLSKVAERYPDVIKILSTAYSDLDAAIGSVNKGGIYRYITKPWEVTEFEVTLRRAMEFFMVRKERNVLMSAKLQALGNVLYASRLAAFALAPVVSGAGTKRAAEAVAAFVRLGAFGTTRPSGGGEMDAGIVSWEKAYAQAGEMASRLENLLKEGLGDGSLNEGRAPRLVAALQAAGAADAALETTDKGLRVTAGEDPMPRLMAAAVGLSDGPADGAMEVLAALMGILDAGGSVRRLRGDKALVVELSEARPREEGEPGAEVARWLFDDDLLISSALGLL